MAYEPSLHDRFGLRFLNRQRTARPWQRQDCVRRHLPRHQSVVHAVCECVQCVATYNHIAVYDTKRLGRSPRAVATYTGVQSAPRTYP